MPRKPKAAAAADPAAPVATIPAAPIACPACKSKIGSDGKTLHEKSSWLEELIETEGTVEQIDNHVEDLKKKVAAHEATIADLRAQLEAANKKSQEKKENTSGVVRQTTAGQPAKPRRQLLSWD